MRVRMTALAGAVAIAALLAGAAPASAAPGDASAYGAKLNVTLLGNPAASEGGLFRVPVDVIAGHKAVFEPQAIPAVVFTDPEIAWAGLTEEQAKRESHPYEEPAFDLYPLL